MTTATATMEYAAPAMYGNVAYDYRRAVPEIEIPEEKTRQSAPSKQRTRAEAKGAAKAKARAYAEENARAGFSPLAFVGFLAVVALVVLVLLAHVKLTEISDETARIQSELYTYYERTSQLEVEYENAFNLNEVEDYATYVLGMVHASESQKQGIEVPTEDKAMVLEKKTTFNADAFTEVKTFLSSLLAYFG